MPPTVQQETAERLDAKAARETKAFGMGATDQGLRLISVYFETYLRIFERRIQESYQGNTFRGRKRELREIDPEELTLASMFAGVSAIGASSTSKDDLSNNLSYTFRYIGRSLELVCYGHRAKLWNKKLLDKWEPMIKRATTLAHRTRLLKMKAKEAGFDYKDWDDSDRLNAAAWVVEGLLEGPMFAIDSLNQLTLTEEGMGELSLIMERLIHAGAFVRPQASPPEPWNDTKTYIEGFKHNLVRTHQKAVQSYIRREFRSGNLEKSIEAVNFAQGVAWMINEPILDLIKWSYENGVEGVGLPSKKPIVIPKLPKPWQEMTQEEQILFTKDKTEKLVANKGNAGERIILSRDLTMAEELRGKPFWTHMNLDYRGRLYGMPHFNFQRSDHIRALFMFDEGQVVSEEGLYWLKVHVANCWAQDGIDKKPFDERVQWVSDNYSWLYDVACAPTRYLEWTKADSPFMFVAACRALLDALRGLPVHIPVSFDGSCSGLQHLCAMMRAEEGSLVNLTPTSCPQDIYQEVANRVAQKVEVSDDPLASLWKAYGIGRSVVKRNVMTYSYSSKVSGMTDQIMSDIMKKLRNSVLYGVIPEHPFGDNRTQAKASRFLAKLTYQSIEEVVEKPAQAMKFLQQMSKLFSHEGKPTTWRTPLGFPVMMRYTKSNTKKVQLFLHDKGIKLRINANSLVGDVGINKRKASNGVAPSFVHSMDACHLMMVLLRCKAEGINSVALVHDSFGCLPNDAPRFRDYIRQEFRRLYDENDVLEQFRNEALSQLEVNPMKVPQVPPNGTLDLSLIEKSDYCFA